LVPVFIDEALPGDTMTMRMSMFARLATPLHPIMDNMYMDAFFFAVPVRILWDNWKKFNGEQIDPGDSTSFLVPQVTQAAGYAKHSLGDYFGLPVGIANMSTNALFFRAYNLIWNEWFRDENMQDHAFEWRNDGPQTAADYPMRKRGKRHDYFTSCLPWPQKGTAVELPLGTSAPVIPNAPGDYPRFTMNSVSDRNLIAQDSPANTVDFSGANVPANEPIVWDDPKLKADLSAATAATINAIRQAFQIQKLYERDARGGTRYTEILRSHFGVVSPDARLQRPEFLGGSSSPVSMHVVPQTGEAGTTPQGTLAGFGTVQSTAAGFNKSFTEHSIIMGLVSVRADLSYQQGLNRMHSRSTRWDFFWPALAHIGEQAVLNQEIYMDDSANDILTFGYQERWAEYRYKPSLITGQLRSQDAASLDTWHLAQDFSVLPTLNNTFIQETPPLARVIATSGEIPFLFDAYFTYRSVRPMPTYSVPGLIDHF
jgi:hypothetical protein